MKEEEENQRKGIEVHKGRRKEKGVVYERERMEKCLEEREASLGSDNVWDVMEPRV